jgi:peptide/nickel transport system permease protein
MTTIESSSGTAIDPKELRRELRHVRLENFQRGWYKFSRNKLSVVGLVMASSVIIMAVFAPLIAPYPKHAGPFANFSQALKPPSLEFLFGTDNIGRDVLSRIIFAFRPSLIMGITVLGISVPVGVFLGLLAGYAMNTWLDSAIMRITDVFISIPPLILAMSIAAMLKPNLTNAMFAVTICWWPWYARITYGLSSSYRNEEFVKSAELIGAGWFHIIIREILPNCLGTIITAVSIDMAFVILLGSGLSFVGLGMQPPTPDLGTMVAAGSQLMPQWWLITFPALAIVYVVIGFNFLGDGINDLLASEKS